MWWESVENREGFQEQSPARERTQHRRFPCGLKVQTQGTEKKVTMVGWSDELILAGKSGKTSLWRGGEEVSHALSGGKVSIGQTASAKVLGPGHPKQGGRCVYSSMLEQVKGEEELRRVGGSRFKPCRALGKTWGYIPGTGDP